MPEANILVLADKVCWLSSPGNGHYLGLLGGGHCFKLDDHGYGSCEVGEVKYEDVLNLFYKSDNLSMSHQSHCSGIIMVSDPSFSELTK